MLSDKKFSLEYSTGEVEPDEFYFDALCNSNRFDLGLGFFNSSGFQALAFGFAKFIHLNGTMRIIINDSLEEDDKNAIERGLVEDPDSLIEEKIIKSFDKLFKTLSKQDEHFFNCLSWLIASKRLEIKAVVPTKGSAGIAHQKYGIFYDTHNSKVGFSGSANFSKSAMQYNLETLSCYCSWKDGELPRVEHYENLFNKNWEGKSEVSRIIPLNKVKVNISNKFKKKDINTLLEDENGLIHDRLKDKKQNLNKSTFLQHEIPNVIFTPYYNKSPQMPSYIKLYDYQLNAFIEWEKSNYIGFFEMATGTGKTITALNCALNLYNKGEALKTIILVPTKTLVNQWSDELNSFNFQNIILAYSENPGWPLEVLKLMNQNFRKKISFSLVTTYQTFITDKFQSVLSKLNSKTLIIADEAHNFGTSRMIQKHPIKFEYRIGLSATPVRHFDEEGTNDLLKFFNSTNGPTFKLDMQEAIERGFLTNYYYYPLPVYLTDEEMVEYKLISIKLQKFYSLGSGTFIDNPIVSNLLLQRKRIIHKASNKIVALRKALALLNEESSNNIKYTLIYVPEGISENEDLRLIDEYAAVVVNEFGLSQHQFIGETKKRDKILENFANGNTKVLTAMKCLDEGVDVQRTENAIFCASTSNPRQFIQRRGRILRKHKDKDYARIYDMVVVPQLTQQSLGECIKMERNIFKGELKRIYEFASLSNNKFQALKSLENIAEEFSIDIFLQEE